MDSLTQAALGALCGELVLGKKLGNYGILWGLALGTLPDLDIIAYPFLSASEQLAWHRGISHSVLFTFVASLLFGWLIHRFYRNREPDISLKRASAFVFLAWSTHVLIDCFNTYGTMIMEPFSNKRYSIDNLFIIDLFFLIPIILCLILCMTWLRKSPKAHLKIATITSAWLGIYFIVSLWIKHLANQHFEAFLADKGIRVTRMVTAPTFSNIFLWRMIADDIDGETMYTSYWSVFDDANTRANTLLSLKKDHQLEATFADSVDLQTITWFTDGWHKTYVDPRKPNTIYIAAMRMGEMQIPYQDGYELRPAFIWSITRHDDGSYELARAFKMSKDGSKHMKKAVGKTISRAMGDRSQWLSGDIKWSWDILSEKQPAPNQ